MFNDKNNVSAISCSNDYDRVKIYIRDKSSVSIAQLQLEVGLSYGQVKKFIAKLTEEGFITGVIDGARYGINTEVAQIKTLTRDEALAIYALLSKDEVDLLAGFKNGSEKDRLSLGLYESLITAGLITARADKLYLNCDNASVDLIKSFDLNDFDWFAEKVIVELTAAVLKSDNGAEHHIEKLSTVGDNVKSAVLTKAEEYRKSGTELRAITKDVTLERVKYMLIENVVLGNDLASVNEYVRLIKNDISLICRIGARDGEFHKALILAAEELADVSDEFIRDLKKLLS